VSDGPPGGAPSGDGDDPADLQVELRRTELRLAGLRRQMDLRLQRIEQLTSDCEQVRAEREQARTELAVLMATDCEQVRAERDQARTELAVLMATRTFRYSRLPRRLYGALRARLGAWRRP
jgi:uncharacterized protein (DUF3084 family)